ncbi:MAG: metal-dependent hydrolase [Planctomycetota bacterium]|nr:metal-dependent hydrolase [Planctomycetota bacterium]
MEQVTQAILGGVAAQAVFGKTLGKRAWVVGAVAGVLPDIDLFFEPWADPRFPIELHRTWTHALAITPVGALVALALFLPFKRFRAQWKPVYGAALVGWLTHAPLDACTSYGTKIWLPFSDAWVAWDLISIIDPVFSIVLLVGLVLAVRRVSSRPAVVALCLALLYLGLGMLQRERALGVQRQLADARGHTVEHARAIPVLGSIVLWRTLYRAEAEHAVVADAHRLVPFWDRAVQERGSRPRLHPRIVASDSSHVVHRFFTFTDGLAVVGARPGAASDGSVFRASDPRYSLTYGLDGMWGMDIGSMSVHWFDARDDVAGGIGSVLAQVFGTDGAWRSLDDVLETYR